MEPLNIVYGILFGIFLTIGDGIAIQHRMRVGFKRSLGSWLAMVLVPIVVSLFISWQITLIALVLSTILSALMAWQSRKGRSFSHDNGE